MRLFIAVAALAIASTLPAQNPGGIPWEDPPERRMTVKKPLKGEWMLGVDGGISNYVQDVFQKKSTRFNVFVERNVFSWVGLQADVNCGKGTVLATPFRPSYFLGVCTGALSAVIPIPVSYSLWPYLRVGGGLALWDEDAREGFWDTDDTSPAFVAAVGTRYFPFGNDKVALRVDIQQTLTTLQDVKVSQLGFGFGVSVRIP
jgi:hypothetical protein